MTRPRPARALDTARTVAAELIGSALGLAAVLLLHPHAHVLASDPTQLDDHHATDPRPTAGDLR